MENYKTEYKHLPKNGFGNEKLLSKLQNQFKELDTVKSLYIWGDPGCGKSFLMEQFYKHLEIQNKKFLHY